MPEGAQLRQGQKLPYLELNYKDYTSEHLAMMIQRKLKDLVSGHTEPATRAIGACL